MVTMVSRDRKAKIFAVTEEDKEGDTWIESVFYYKALAEQRAERLRQKTDSLIMVTELGWDYRIDGFRVQEPASSDEGHNE